MKRGPMALTREQICSLTSRKLSEKAQSLKSLKAMVGLDGFVDEIIAVVDKRHDHGKFEAVKTIDRFGAKITAAAGESSNYELVVKQRKLGGNGPIMANALASMGLDVTYVGNLGYPNIDPVFQDFAKKAKVISIAEPGHTDALEFEDGKLMLGKHETLHDVNWDNLLSRVGRDNLNALKLLTRFQDQVDVILGLNLKESLEVADVLGLPGRSDPEASIEENARAIRQNLKLSCVVIHPRRCAAAATESASARFSGPFVQQPKISTGAGDHFNAGFCLGHLLGFSLEESLCTGVGASGYYVRTADSPTGAQLAEFVAKLPPPQS